MQSAHSGREANVISGRRRPAYSILQLYKFTKLILGKVSGTSTRAFLEACAGKLICFVSLIRKMDLRCSLTGICD